MKDTIYRHDAIDALETIGYDFSDSELSAVELEELCEAVGDVRQDMINRIRRMPSAEPRRESGNWLITDAYPHKVYCSKCFATIAQKNWHIWEDGSLPRKFCPNCGADMRGDSHDGSN